MVQNGPKKVQKWSKKWFKNGPKMVQKWSKNGQNGQKIVKKDGQKMAKNLLGHTVCTQKS